MRYAFALALVAMSGCRPATPLSQPPAKSGFTTVIGRAAPPKPAAAMPKPAAPPFAPGGPINDRRPMMPVRRLPTDKWL